MIYFTTHLSFNRFVKKFLNWQTFGEVIGKMVHTPYLPCTFVLKEADLAR